MDFELTAQQRKSLLVGVAGIAFACASYWWLSQPGSEPVATPSVSTEIAAPTAVVIVDVEGGVVSPGVVELPSGSRVRDAVSAAGGLRPGVEAGTNLARIVEDGEQIVIGARPGAQAATDGRLNINSATQSQLEELPGVGPVLAARLISYREEHGRFRNLAALDAVSGVGPAMLENLKEVVSFE